MTTVAIPCECGAEEHDVEVSAELGGYGVRASIGLYAPTLGDPLPCGRQLTKADLELIVSRLEERNVDEG